MAIARLIGVYDADGTLRGEVAYLWGKLTGTRHCALCDITHSPVRRKREWDQYAAGLPVPFDLVHLDERDDRTMAAMAGHAAPVVIADRTDGTAQVVLTATDLERAQGSVSGFAELLAAAVSDLAAP
jgi:hypothetical protein